MISAGKIHDFELFRFIPTQIVFSEHDFQLEK